MKKTIIILLIFSCCSCGVSAQIKATCISNSKAQDSLTFDILKVPFSFYGSYMAILKHSGLTKHDETGFFIHDVSGKYLWENNSIFKITPVKNGREISCQTRFAPFKLIISGENGTCEICFEDHNTLRFRCTNMDLKLQCVQKVFSTSSSLRKGQWTIPDYIVTSIEGNATQTTDSNNYCTFSFTPGSKLIVEFAVENTVSRLDKRVYDTPFDACILQSKEQVQQLYAKCPSLPEKYENTRKLALYLNWSSVVAPRDNMIRFGMLMSKNWMWGIWSWDNCFNALAAAYTNPDLVWQQIQLISVVTSNIHLWG
jgi:putative isomerase